MDADSTIASSAKMTDQDAQWKGTFVFPHGISGMLYSKYHNPGGHSISSYLQLICQFPKINGHHSGDITLLIMVICPFMHGFNEYLFKHHLTIDSRPTPL